MRRPTSLATLLAVLLLQPVAAGQAQAQDSLPGAITGTVHGVRSDLMPTVEIVAYDSDSTNAAGDFNYYAVPADPDGQFRIDGMAAGSYLVAARSPEYGAQFFDRAGSPADAAPVLLEEGDEVAGIDFWLTRPGIGSGSFSGTVIAEDSGNPLAARVYAMPANGPEILFRQVTDRSGQFRFDSLAAGLYVVQVQAEGYVGEWYDDATARMAATYVLVADSNETFGIDFALARAGAITGQVRERDGLPFEGVRVTAWPVAFRDSTVVIPPDSSGGIGPDGSFYGWGPMSYSASTGPAGRYRIDGLPAGLYIVSASGWTAWQSVTVWYDGVRDPGLATEVGVRGGTTVDGIDFVLPLSTGEGSISGRVTDASGDPVSGAWVTPVHASNPAGADCCPEWGGASTDRDGRYELHGLPPGEYFVRAASYGQWARVERWYPDAETIDTALPVPVHRDEATAGIDITLPVGETGASISGTVKDATGEPLVWAQVLVQDLDSMVGELDRLPIQAWAWTDSLGSYTVGGLPPGSFVISASWWDGDRYGHAWYDGAETFEKATPVILPEDGDVTGIDIVLDPEFWYGGIGGRVVDAAGQPVERAFVEVKPVSTRDGFAPFRYREPHAITDADGRFVIGRLPVGEYLLRGFADGAFAWFDGTPFAAMATPLPVTGGDTTRVVLELESRIVGTGAIEGHVRIDQMVDWAPAVTDASELVPRVAVVTARSTSSVLMSPLPERFYPAVTKEDGSYSIPGLPPGEYVVRAFAPDFVGEWYDDAYDPADADPVKVDGATPATGIDFALVPIYWMGATDGAERAGSTGVRGEVFDESGASIVGATVFLMNADGLAVASTETAPDGTYVLDGIFPGSYRLMVTKEGFAASFNGGAPNLDAAVSVDLLVGVAVVDLTLRSGTATVIEDPGDLPVAFRLRGNYPNPFNPQTTVLVDIPEAADVRVQVFDLLGRRVLEVHAGPMSAGGGQAIRIDGSMLSSGLYLYRVAAVGAARSWHATGQMTLVK